MADDRLGKSRIAKIVNDHPITLFIVGLLGNFVGLIWFFGSEKPEANPFLTFLTFFAMSIAGIDSIDRNKLDQKLRRYFVRNTNELGKITRILLTITAFGGTLLVIDKILKFNFFIPEYLDDLLKSLGWATLSLTFHAILMLIVSIISNKPVNKTKDKILLGYDHLFYICCIFSSLFCALWIISSYPDFSAFISLIFGTAASNSEAILGINHFLQIFFLSSFLIFIIWTIALLTIIASRVSEVSFTDSNVGE